MKLLIFCALIGSISCGFKDHAHRIYIGTALQTPYLDKDANYKRLAAENFNCMTPEYEMKIGQLEPVQGQFKWGDSDRLVNFALQNGMKIRGHNLVWHIEVPDWMFKLSGDALKKAMVNHITTVVSHYKGRLFVWDVVNEIFNDDGTLRDSLWSRNFNDSFVALAFQTAHAADPNAKLYINDYSIAWGNAKFEALYNFVKRLLSQGVPIHGVGFQSHFSVGEPARTSLKQNMQRIAALGLDVAVTELDIAEKGKSDADQANDYALVIKDCLAVSRCVGVTLWGISDNYSWLGAGERPLPFDSNYQPKAAATAINNNLQ